MEFALEIIGFSLTVLEIFFPRKAVLLEEWLDSLPRKAPKIFFGRLLSQANVLSDKVLSGVAPELADDKEIISLLTPTESLLWHLRNLLIVSIQMAGIGAVFAGISYVLIELTGYYVIPTGMIAIFAIVFFTSTFGLFVTILSLVSVLFIKGTVGFLNTLTNGRALGAVGLLLAGWGLSSKILFN